ncbi:MAG: polysulfide reductase NrfD [Nitrospirae bacterium]|nr:polysulfide reductase NrfD [Nitrospirota bacterium]
MIHWNYLITFYLFSAGVSAGAMIVSIAAGFIDPVKYGRVVRAGAYIAPFPIMAGMVGLIFDLERPRLFWLLLTTFQYKSIMSVGAWIITLFSAISIVYFILTLPKNYLKLKSKPSTLTAIKLTGLVISTCVALYTGLLLSTLSARPFWNTAMTPVLLFISAVIDGLAAVSLVLCLTPGGFGTAYNAGETSSDEQITNRHIHRFIDRVDFILLYLLLLATVIFLICMGRSTQSAASALSIVMNGRLGLLFWLGFVAAGIIVPMVAASYKLTARTEPHMPRLNFISSVLALMGGYIVRAVILDAGQVTGAIIF